MVDREKVIKGLECIIWEVDHNSMWLPGDDDIRDAITLLKEQEAVVPEWKNGSPFCGNCGHRLEKKSRNTDGIKCPTCERSVKWE